MVLAGSLFSGLWNGSGMALEWAIGMIWIDNILLFLLLRGFVSLSRDMFFVSVWISSFWRLSIMGLCWKCGRMGFRDGWVVLGRWMGWDGMSGWYLQLVKSSKI